ncbi:MAG: hypothetical protein FWH57_00400 [Oscillospiraceae bacterium]|nr:hypothetical protein [Oscillospiraceae bacterium]
MNQGDIRNRTNEQTVEDSNIDDSTSNENVDLAEDCSCNIFSYKRPTMDDSKKTKRKTCC